MIELVAVNVARPTVLAAVSDEQVLSGIAKQPVEPSATLHLTVLNLDGDEQADLTVHGGVDKAVYAYPSEHLDAWRAELDDTDLGPAPFGENLSTAGVLEDVVRIGDVWRWGSARLQVSQPRWPCFKLALYRERADIQARMRRTGRTGWYFRVLEPGDVPVAGPIEVETEDAAGITVRDAHLAMADTKRLDVARLHAVAEHPALAPSWRDPLLDRLAR
jgi:MOSC domain-containing protein YiiM